MIWLDARINRRWKYKFNLCCFVFVFFFLIQSWLTWLKFVILCTCNQQGNPHYRMALKIMEHFCCMKKRIFILVMWRTCFVLVLALNHHSSLLSLLHIQHLQYFLHSSRGWGNVLLLCFSMFLIETKFILCYLLIRTLLAQSWNDTL